MLGKSMQSLNSYWVKTYNTEPVRRNLLIPNYPGPTSCQGNNQLVRLFSANLRLFSAYSVVRALVQSILYDLCHMLRTAVSGTI